jgi:3-hydroxyisobutyrate dehydrogenase-like beta-hydroxyacid dehydrogenase
MPSTLGLLHPGEMGSAIGACLVRAGQRVLCASAGRSAATRQRAREAGLVDVGLVDQLVAECQVVLSVCPPHAARDVANATIGFTGIYVEANAVSPRTVREIGSMIGGAGSVVDGGIIGAPPGNAAPGGTRFYLAGPEATAVARLFDATPVAARVIDGELGAASALKMTYAAWTKSSAALLLAIRALARASDVEMALLREWEESQPGLSGRTLQAGRSAATKGWRWVAEMQEIAATFADAELPDGFHRAAAEIYRRSPHLEAADRTSVDVVIEAIRHPGGAART